MIIGDGNYQQHGVGHWKTDFHGDGNWKLVLMATVIEKDKWYSQ